MHASNKMRKRNGTDKISELFDLHTTRKQLFINAFSHTGISPFTIAFSIIIPLIDNPNAF